MSRLTSPRRRAVLGALTLLLLALVSTRSGFVTNANAAGTCTLNAENPAIQHVIYLQFDNTHFRRDNPNVPSDLEQMPHLLNFLKGNGTLLTNDHTILISHTAGGILSSFTGLYPDRNGVTVSNSYRYFTGTGATGSASSSAFKYWTDFVDDTGNPALDGNYNMITDNGKNTPAPWVPFTRAGCDVGAIASANIVLENTSTGPHGDITEVFGNPSPEATEVTTDNASANPQIKAQPQADFVGMAIHCATGGGICTGQPAANVKPDVLPDEPGGYAGFKALFGGKYVNPAITGGGTTVNDINGAAIQDPTGNPGFPGFDAMSAAVSLGLTAKMQEAGVPVTYAYISDAHDAHPSGPAYGPGETGYEAALQAYDAAFATFFTRLTADGITKANTLFVVTVDEGDHFDGDRGIPQPNGTRVYNHVFCDASSVPAFPNCAPGTIGEVSLNLAAALPGGEPVFTVHSDSAPTFYVKPGTTTGATRQLERDMAALKELDPYANPKLTRVVQRMADSVEEKILHMVNNDPARTPTFTAFQNADFFSSTFAPSCAGNPCVDYHFAWNHGDIQDEIGNTWIGYVGPGVRHLGVNPQIWSDHTDLRPTMLSLLGLKDDYVDDGRVICEIIADHRPGQPDGNCGQLQGLGGAYKQLNAPFGQFSKDTLLASTRALSSGSPANDHVYMHMEDQLQSLGTSRDQLAGQIRQLLFDVEFNGAHLHGGTTDRLRDQANELINRAARMAEGPDWD